MTLLSEPEKRPSFYEKHQKTITHIVILAQVFLAEVPRGIVLATMPCYILLLIDTESTINDQMILGIAVSMFAAGRLLSSVPFGAMVDRTQSTRMTLMVACFISIVGNSMYAAAGAFRSQPKVAVTILTISRFIIGFGSGTLGVTRAYVALLSTPENRTKYLSWNTLMQYIGFSLSPGFALLVGVIFPYSDKSPFEEQAVSTAYGPSALVIGLFLFMMAMQLLLPYHDPPSATGQQMLEQQLEKQNMEEAEVAREKHNLQETEQPSSDLAPMSGKESIIHEKDIEMLPKSTEALQPVPHPEDDLEKSLPVQLPMEEDPLLQKKRKCGFMLFFFLNFTLRGLMGVVETFGAKQYEAMVKQSANGHHVERAGMVFTAVGAVGVLTFFVIAPLERRFSAYNVLLFGILLVTIGSILLIPEIMLDNVIQFVAGLVLIWSWGGPICQTLTVSAYSQMLGARPQGAQMGWLTFAGSLGRVLFPLLAGVSFLVAHVTDVIMGIISMASVVAFAMYFHIPLCQCFGKRKP